MASLLKKLTHFNLIVGIVLFAISKSIGNNWYELVFIIFPILFNWKILYNLKIQKFNLGIWNYLTGIIGLLYALSLIITCLTLLYKLPNEKGKLLLLEGIHLLFSLTLIVHFVLAMQMKKSWSKIKLIHS